MITREKCDKIVIEDYRHKHWVVYAQGKYGVFQKRSYKTYTMALAHSVKISDYYQAPVVEVSK